MRMKVLYHDSCFDGAASAAVFSRFYLDKVHPGAELAYEGLFHKAGGQGIDEAVFTGDENAIVDFRYSQSPKLTWWFDHHVSAFQQPGDEEHFRRDASGRKFHDGARKSCTVFIADVVRDRYGWSVPEAMKELLHWAEIVDGALFESPRQAVELAEPALQLMTVLEANKDPALIPRVIGELQRRPLAEVVAEPWIQGPLKPLMERHRANIEVVRKKAVLEKGVVFFDVADEGLDSLNKFIAYSIYPEARYVIWVGRGEKRCKISLGSNPWRPQTRTHNLAKIAERYGGGGHPVVGAASFGAGELGKTRQAAAEIVAELRGS